MAKREIRKLLSQMDSEKLVEIMMELYNIKEARMYLDSLLAPHFDQDIEVFKEKLDKLFAPSKLKLEVFSKAKKIIREFKKVNATPEYMAELMLYIPVKASRRAKDTFVGSYEYNALLASSLRSALEFIIKNNLLEEYKERILSLLYAMTTVQNDGFSLVRTEIKAFCPEILEN